MKHPNQSFEFESQKQIVTEMPVSELIFDTQKIERIWSIECNNPQFVEQIESRKKISESVTNAFDKLSSPTITIQEALGTGELTTEQTTNFYNSLSDILEDNDYQRLALYLPFEIFPNKSWITGDRELNKSIDRFEETYLGVWYNLLNIQDMRANFVDGDVLESDARPSDPPRIVKAAHLIPWLVMRGMIKIDDISIIMDNADPVLKRSIADTLPILDNLGLLSTDEKDHLFKIKSSTPAEEIGQPLYISEGRKKWLETKDLDNNTSRPDKNINKSSLPQLSGPFSDNLEKMSTQVEDINNRISTCTQIDGLYPIAILGGSRLKGYGDINSDIDVCMFVKSDLSSEDEVQIDDNFIGYNLNKIKLENDGKLADPKENWVHELFNTAWVGKNEAIISIQQKLIPEYFYEQDPDIRASCIERLEQDLLQYRLMHKGYARHYPVYSERLPNDQEIDGQSAFYDSGYRQIATKLYIDKVFIPKISVI